MTGFEKHSAAKSDHVKENGIGDSTNQRSNKKLQPDNPAFSRSHIQASGGRGPGMYSLLPPPKKQTGYVLLQNILIAFQVGSNFRTRTISKGRIPSLT